MAKRTGILRSALTSVLGFLAIGRKARAEHRTMPFSTPVGPPGPPGAHKTKSAKGRGRRPHGRGKYKPRLHSPQRRAQLGL